MTYSRNEWINAETNISNVYSWAEEVRLLHSPSAGRTGAVVRLEHPVPQERKTKLLYDHNDETRHPGQVSESNRGPWTKHTSWRHHCSATKMEPGEVSGSRAKQILGSDLPSVFRLHSHLPCHLCSHLPCYPLPFLEVCCAPTLEWGTLFVLFWFTSLLVFWKQLCPSPLSLC